jgi:hypothetical protein
MKTKLLFVLLGAAGLSGCAVYPVPAYDAYGQASPAYVTAPAPVYIQGGAVYRSGPAHAPAPRGRHWHGGRDQDRDGIPNYRDRDRDGDGARNGRDRWPNDGRAR